MTLLRHLFLRLPIALLLCFLIGIPPAAFADGVPHLLNYQGRVAVDGQNFTGTGYFKFALVDGGSDQNRTATAVATVSGSNRFASIAVTDGGRGYTTPPAVTIQGTGTGATFTASISNGAVTGITVNAAGDGYAAVPPPVVVIAPPPADEQVSTLWTNDGSGVGTSEKEPDSAVQLPVNKGLYALLLGDKAISGMSPLDASIFAGTSDLRLRVWFSREPGSFTLLTPDQRIAAVGYAMMAEDVKDGSITGAKLAPGAVTADSIAPGAISVSQLSPELQASLTALLATQQTFAPVVTSANTVSFAVETSLSYTITASGSPTSFGATGLPAGLSLNGSVVSGSPAAGPGTYTFSVTATNIHGTSTPKLVTVQAIGPVHVDFAAGNDVNVGTPALPVKTLAQGLALAAAVSPRRNVRVSTAAHTIYEAMAVPGGVTVSGGYTPGAVWTRAGSSRTPLHRAMDLGGVPPLEGLIAVKLLPASSGSGPAGLEYFDITMDDVPASNSPRNCIGVYMTAATCSSSERVTHCRITPGSGGSALPGNNGSNGTDGEDGADGGGANYWLGATGPFHGGDGANLGTQGNFNTTADPGGDGSNGQSPIVAAGGAGGSNGSPIAGNGGDGEDGVDGAPGSHGLAGLDGGLGRSGVGGGGGGGGGGIGGAIGQNGFLLPDPTLGGGGGGAGGRPGSYGWGGSGGKKGGHSIAIRINGTGFYTTPVLTNNILRPRDGGAGGNGGNGGVGGQGGRGGQGVIRPVDGAYHPGNGGNGGDGGDGGGGGGGGGGHGGNSFGIYATKIEMLDYVVAPVTQSGNTFELGNGGAGGTGGLRGGSTTSRASNGNAGFAQNISTSP